MSSFGKNEVIAETYGNSSDIANAANGTTEF
jgi:hypothetical protein